MANAQQEVGDEKPQHVLVWLDQHISVPGNCQNLKHAFSTCCHPENVTPVKLNDKDYEEVIKNVGPTEIIFEGVKFLLAAFTDPEKCVEFFKLHTHKRIFFITSGSLGKIAVPQIMKQHANIFHNPHTQLPYASIYVYCADIAKNMDWIMDHLDYIQAFTFDKDLLVRMIRDIADYFLLEAKRLWDISVSNCALAENRLNWAGILYHRYEDMEKVKLKEEFNDIEIYETKIKNYKDTDDQQQYNAF